jgi:hypothetical protein
MRIQNSFEESIPASLGPHPDYQKNLEMAKNFSKNIEKNQVAGLTTKTSDYVMTISFFPPHDSSSGIHAFPINLHQSQFSFSQELEKTYSFYFNRAQKFWELRNIKIESAPYPEIVEKASSFAQNRLPYIDE